MPATQMDAFGPGFVPGMVTEPIHAASRAMERSGSTSATLLAEVEFEHLEQEDSRETDQAKSDD